MQERRFIWNEAVSEISKAQTRDDYLEAAADYQALINLGARNGRLFYNLGTTLLMAGEYQDAEQAFIRAEIHEGKKADIRQNMEKAVREQNNVATGSWSRTIFFWHYDFPLTIRIGLTTALFLLCWCLLIFRMFAAYREFKVLMPIVLILLIMMGSSIGSSLLIEIQNKQPKSLLSLPDTNTALLPSDETIIEGSK
jgi:tetratricopeptide (TPR) repeat protein